MTKTYFALLHPNHLKAESAPPRLYTTAKRALAAARQGEDDGSFCVVEVKIEFPFINAN
jgi:hypothetical protein